MKKNKTKNDKSYIGIGMCLGLLAGALFMDMFGYNAIMYGMLGGMIIGSLFD